MLSGILVIDKPHGITSHDAVAAMRRRFQTKRVGHAGTLDPLATGVLVIAIGNATRFLQYLPLEPKIYECEVTFGETRNTQDAEGEVTSNAPVPDNLEELIRKHLPTLTGAIQQIPPMFSAVKRQGKPLYFYARQGQEIEREPRPVTIHKFDLVEVQEGKAHLYIECSGGTYVRTLAHDLGQLVGCGAYLTGLTRTVVGNFTLEEAAPLEEVRDEEVIPIREALSNVPEFMLNLGQEKLVLNGGEVRAARPIDGDLVQLVNTAGATISIAKVQPPYHMQPLCVIPANVSE
ncbi:MAG: tRNA pseudouridine(55) synthase TruB [Chthonomonas sp.]|nr:tRNA pseudouridine(55) synthase TruB [Chthonomonas sp.]